MKIYHTETQEDYDALMAELKLEGCTWGNREIPIKGIRWEIRRDVTCVHVSDAKIMTVAKKSFFAYHEPDTPITKYKAKVNEMRFTKENVLKVTDKWVENKIVSFQDLQNQIKELDDTPEKVIVPKFVAEWIERNKESEVSLQIMLKCYQNYYYNMNRKCQTDEEKAVQWYVDNPYKFIQAYEEGYTIEPEQLYCIPLPHLETSDGIQQVLSQRENRMNYFASTPHKILKQRFTKEELEQVPEIYRLFAKPIEEE